MESPPRLLHCRQRPTQVRASLSSNSLRELIRSGRLWNRPPRLGRVDGHGSPEGVAHTPCRALRAKATVSQQPELRGAGMCGAPCSECGPRQQRVRATIDGSNKAASSRLEGRPVAPRCRGCVLSVVVSLRQATLWAPALNPPSVPPRLLFLLPNPLFCFCRSDSFDCASVSVTNRPSAPLPAL
jgi:hypothetical protein